MTTPLTESQQVLAEELKAILEEQAQEELEQIAATLASVEDSQLFGATEFAIRDLVLKIAQKAYNVRLRQKKTAMKDPQ